MADDTPYVELFKSRFITWTDVKRDLVVHGCHEPVMTVLELAGVTLYRMFVVGPNPKEGSIIVPTEERAKEIGKALNPSYEVEIHRPRLDKPDWWVRYTQRRSDDTPYSEAFEDIEFDH